MFFLRPLTEPSPKANWTMPVWRLAKMCQGLNDGGTLAPTSAPTLVIGQYVKMFVAAREAAYGPVRALPVPNSTQLLAYSPKARVLLVPSVMSVILVCEPK